MKVVSSPAAHMVVIEGAKTLLRANQNIELVGRTGVAHVEAVDGDLVIFAQNLNTSIPAAARGDEVRIYKTPCTRCKCDACEAWRRDIGWGRMH